MFFYNPILQINSGLQRLHILPNIAQLLSSIMKVESHM